MKSCNHAAMHFLPTFPPIFFHLAAALVLVSASGGQGDSFRENVKHVPLDPLQKLLFITAKGENQVLSLLARPDHVK